MNLTRPAHKFPEKPKARGGNSPSEPKNHPKDKLKPHPSHGYEALTDEDGNPTPDSGP